MTIVIKRLGAKEISNVSGEKDGFEGITDRKQRS
jgi:hypothetical protein